MKSQPNPLCRACSKSHTSITILQCVGNLCVPNLCSAVLHVLEVTRFLKNTSSSSPPTTFLIVKCKNTQNSKCLIQAHTMWNTLSSLIAKIKHADVLKRGCRSNSVGKWETLEKIDFTVLVLTIRQAVRGRIYDKANIRAVTPEYVFPKRMWEQVDSQWARSFFVYRATRRPQKCVTFFSYLKARRNDV